MKPTATTFSDLAVISYPVEPPFALPNDILGAADTIWRDEVLRHMIDLVAQLAARALRLELLVRGGICRGQLVHNADFILGPALIEAYRLESQTAIYPRIIVSSSLHEGDENLFPSLLRVDQRDGLAHLDYLPQLAALEGAKGFDGGASWRAARLLDIDSNIKRHRARRRGLKRCSWFRCRPDVADKWEWFRQYFETGTLDYAASSDDPTRAPESN